MTTQTMTFTAEQLDILLDRFFDQYRHNPEDRKGEKYAEQYANIFKKVGKAGGKFYWEGVDDLSEYLDSKDISNGYCQWLIDTGECEDWEEAQDCYANREWDECDVLDWAFTMSPNSDDYRIRETRNIKDLYIKLLDDEYDAYDSHEDLLNKAITDVTLAQKILTDLTK